MTLPNDRPVLPPEPGRLRLPYLYTAGKVEVSLDSEGISMAKGAMQRRLLWSEIRRVRRAVGGAIELADASNITVVRLPRSGDHLAALLGAISAQLEAGYGARVRRPMPLRTFTRFHRSRTAWAQLLGAVVILTIAAAWFHYGYYYLTGLFTLASSLAYLSRLPISIDIGPQSVETVAPLVTRRFATDAIRNIGLVLDQTAGPIVMVETADDQVHELRAFGDQALFVFDRLQQSLLPATNVAERSAGCASFNWRPAMSFCALAVTVLACVLCTPVVSGLALHQAARAGAARSAALVLHLRAGIEARDSEGKTPLHNAAKFGRSDVVRLLIARGADARARSANDAGHTPLHAAAEYNQLESVRALLAAGVDPNILNNWRQTPLFQLAMVGKGSPAEIPTVDLLLKSGADINAQEKDGFAPLHVAARREDLVLLRHLLARGARLDTRTRKDVTPLDYAVFRGKWAAARELVAAGADIDLRHEDGESLLGWALVKADPELVRRVLDLGARTDLTDKGWTPLQRVAWNGQEGIARVLLQRGANRTRQRPRHLPCDLPRDEGMPAWCGPFWSITPRVMLCSGTGLRCKWPLPTDSQMCWTNCSQPDAMPTKLETGPHQR